MTCPHGCENADYCESCQYEADGRRGCDCCDPTSPSPDPVVVRLQAEVEAATLRINQLETECGHLSADKAELQEILHSAGDGDTWRAACQRLEGERDELQAAVDQLKSTPEHYLRGCVNVLASKLAYYTGKTVPTEITGAESVLEERDTLRGLLREAVEAPRFDEIPESWFERAIAALEGKQ